MTNEQKEQELLEIAPIANKVFNTGDWLMVPFTLVWLSFALFWEAGVYWQYQKTQGSTYAMPIGFLVFGGFFVLIGLYIAIGRFFYKAYEKRHTKYVLTNKKAMVIKELFGAKEVRSIDLDKAETIDRTVNKDGSGSIYFGSVNWWYRMFLNSGLPIANY